MKAYFDESGGLGQGDTFVIAGVFFEDEKVPSFVADWSAAMSAQPSLDVFKTKEAAGMSGRFRRFSAQERDAKVRALAECISLHATAVIHCTLHLPGFAETIAQMPKPFSYPYFWPFHIVIMASCFDLYERGVRTSCEMVFDTQKVFGPKAERWFPVVRSLFSADPEICVMPVTPTFTDDDDCLPLQAADMVAWLMRSATSADWPAFERLIEGDGIALSNVAPSPFEVAVADQLCKLSLSPHSQFLTPRRLKAIHNKSHTLLRDGTVAAHAGTEVGRLVRDTMHRLK